MLFGWIVAGLLLGSTVGGLSGAVFGGVLGAVLGMQTSLRNRLAHQEEIIRRLGEDVSALENKLPAPHTTRSGEVAADEPSTDERSVDPTPPPRSTELQLQADPFPPERRAPESERPAFASSRLEVGEEPAPEPKGAIAFETAAETLRELLFGGNTVARIGIVVTLVGVTLLVKWAVDNQYFPIEMRMVSAALIGLALIVIGYRMRNDRPDFAQTLQGGGVAAMYLTIFFSFRTYGLLPAGLAFALLAAIAVFSGALAVLQNALPLMVIGEVGGFMAPVLASTGQGNHVALFSYYVLLNLGILGVAWFKAWRLPNLLGFLFTFGVATAWGVLRYEPEQFASTQPFLIIFFLLYLAIPILFAFKSEGLKRGWIDGTLVFGTPLAVLGLQRGLVENIPFGMAFSTVALALVYLVASAVLFKRAPEALRTMAESLLPIGVGFATLAIPYGFDNHNLTGATWALEGAGLYWVGLRQDRWLSRTAGVALQIFAVFALAFASMEYRLDDALPFANTRFLGAFFIAAGSLFVAQQAYANRGWLKRYEWLGLQFLIAWGLFVWLTIGLDEIDRQLQPDWAAGGTLLFLGITGIALELLGRRFEWLPGRYPGALLTPLMGLLLLLWYADVGEPLWADGGVLGWPIYVAAVLFILKRLVPDASQAFHYLHAIWLWSATGFLVLIAGDAATELVDLRADWGSSIALATMAAASALTLRLSRGNAWPFEPYRQVYRNPGLPALLLVMALVIVAFTIDRSADTPPLAYLPVLNPLDLAQLAALTVALAWYVDLRGTNPDAELIAVAPAAIGATAFLWFNGLLARTVHHYAGVSFSWPALWESSTFQAAVSVSWSLLALTVTVWGSRHKARTAWIVGASVLMAVLVKLFLIDLAQLSTPAKIGTFLVVGVLFLMVGYLAPVPPSRPAISEATEEDAT